MTSIGTEHPKAHEIPHVSPLTQTLTRHDSMSGPGTINPGLATSPDGQPVFPPAGIHRGSINGMPGGGLPGMTSRSPAKESSYLARTSSVDENGDTPTSQGEIVGGVSPPSKEGIPIRR
jgi:hypothetical protein